MKLAINKTNTKIEISLETRHIIYIYTNRVSFEKMKTILFL